MGFTMASSKKVGPELASVLPTDKPWYKNSGLLKLNFCLLSLIQFCKYMAFFRNIFYQANTL
jgi:hypothetical protein